MRWFISIFGFLLTSAYCPFIAGAAVTPRWLLLAAAVPGALIVLEWTGRSLEITAAHIVGAAFIGWAALSLLWTDTSYDSRGALWPLLLLGGCFALGSVIDDWRPFLVGAALGLAISSGLLVAEVGTGFHIEQLSGAGAATKFAALFGNRNYLGEAAALLFVAFMVLDRWTLGQKWPAVRLWVWLCLGPALLITRARGAFLGLFVAYCALLWSEGRRFTAMVVASWGVIAAVWAMALWPNLGSLVDRFHIWGDAVLGLTFVGHGIGSFGGTLVAHFTDPMGVRQVYAHNDLLQIAYELGLPGFALALAFIWLILRSSAPERFVFLAFVVEGCFAFPLRLPVTGALAAIMAGCAARRLPQFSIAAFGRGLVLCARPGALGLDGERTS